MIITSRETKKALPSGKDKLSEKMNGSVVITSYLLSLLCNFSNPEHTSHFELVKDPLSKRLNDLLKKKTIPVTLFNSLLTFRDTDKKFELGRDLPKKKIKKKQNDIDLAKLTDKKVLFTFAKEMSFDERALGNKMLELNLRLLKSPAFIASGISRKLFTRKL